MDRVTKLVDSISIPRRFERDQVIMPIVSIVVATAVLYSTYKVISISNKRRENKKLGLKEIPSPGSSYPYVGHMLSLGSAPGRKIAEWHKEIGHIFKLRMGVQTWILVDDPSLAHKIFVTHGAEASHRPHSTYAYEHYSIKGKGVAFAQPTKRWKEARAVVLSVLAPKVVDNNYMELINEEAAALALRFIEYSKSENGTNPVKHLHLNSLNIIFMASFGKRYKAIEDPEFTKLSAMIERTMILGALENDLASFFPIISVVDYFAGTQVMMNKFIETQRNPVYRGLMREALERDGNNVVKSLEEFDLTEDEKLVIMSDLIAGGTDTVSVTLSWIIAIMCNYPQVQKSASAEIDAFIKLNGRLPKFIERTDLPYCVSMLKECMRFRPTTPFGLPHTTDEHIVVDGYIIPKGSSIISSMESMHMNPEIYPEPERFFPERFLNNLKTMQAAANGKLEDRDHFNFGWGRRMCAAIYLAEVELFTSFVHIASRCTIEPLKDADGKEQIPDIVNAVNAGLTLLPILYKVNFVQRSDALV